MTCPLCNRDGDTPITGICTACEARVSQQLAEIVRFAATAATMTEPGRTGDSSRSGTYGSRPPINVNALDYAERLGYVETVRLSDGTYRATYHNGLATLHEWERMIREERRLTPPALIPYAGSQAKEIRNVAAFLLAHLSWATAQSWADELAKEVSDIHRAGMIVLRAVPARRARISCPGDDPETGDICGATIWLPDDLHDYVRQPGQPAPLRTLHCQQCTTAWTFDRLLRVAISVDANAVVRGFGKDFIERHLGVTRRRVNQILAGA